MRTATAASVAALALAAGASFVSADTLKAHYATSYWQNINLTRAGNTNDIPTVTFNWTRTDVPGPGVDATIPVNFDSYCIELTQTVGGGDNVYTVMSPAAAGLSGFQELMLERLWGSFKAGVDSQEKSASFQAAVWEIIYDAASMDIQSGNFLVNAPSTGVQAQAQAYLNAVNVSSYFGAITNIVVLHSEESQDQIANIPAPATAGLGLLSLGALARRRRAV